jgi:hypothetical protein
VDKKLLVFIEYEGGRGGNAGLDAVDERKFVPLLGFETRLPARSAHNLASILTKLFSLLKYKVLKDHVMNTNRRVELQLHAF